jgi:ABC-type nitrate/sulfonate/bicarbonate transport system permease component
LKKRSLNISDRAWQPLVPLAAIILIWQLLSVNGVIPGYMLPGPARVITAFTADFFLLMRHLRYTLLEAMAGLALSAAAAFALKCRTGTAK